MWAHRADIATISLREMPNGALRGSRGASAGLRFPTPRQSGQALQRVADVPIRLPRTRDERPPRWRLNAGEPLLLAIRLARSIGGIDDLLEAPASLRDERATGSPARQPASECKRNVGPLTRGRLLPGQASDT